MWRNKGESEFVLTENWVMEKNKKCGFSVRLLLFECVKINCKSGSR